jgi:PAS domain S-box-containing protein
MDDFATMMRSTRLCVLVHDAETKNILWANPAASEMLGWDVTELRPMKAHEMSSSAQQYDRVIGRAWLQDAVEHGSSRIEWHYRSRSGRVIPTDAVATLIELERGPAVMVQFRDVGSELSVARDLRLATSYIDALARHTSTAALMADRGGVLRFATDSAIALIGADPHQPLGHLTTYVRLRFDGVDTTWDDVVGRATPVTAVRLQVDRPGGPAWLESSVERVNDSQDGTFLMLLHDVSGRVVEEVRRDRDLRRENHSARYTAMGDMAMAMAHEMGQPLAAAGNYLGGVGARLRTLGARYGIPQGELADLQHGLARTESQVGRAKEIVDSARRFVGHQESVAQDVDLNSVLDECEWFVRLRAEAAGVDVVVEPAPGAVVVRCERVLTGQVVLNLCFNAIDEMTGLTGDRPRVVRLSAGRGPGVGTISVEDDGRGVTRDPFAESFTSKEDGSGIGLALSHRIITRQNGSIWAERRAEGGSRFTFALPAVDRVAE